jgi:hypothetical protein
MAIESKMKGSQGLPATREGHYEVRPLNKNIQSTAILEPKLRRVPTHKAVKERPPPFPNKKKIGV